MVPQLDSELGFYSSVLVSSNLSFSSKGIQFRIPKLGFRNEFCFGFKLDRGNGIASSFVVEIGNGVLSVEDSSSVENLNNHNLVKVKENADSEDEDGNGGMDTDNGRKSARIRVPFMARIHVPFLSRSLRLAKTVEDVESVLKGRNDVPLKVYNTIIKVFGRDRYMDAALALVAWLRKKKETGGGIGPNQIIYNSLLGAAKHSGQFGVVERILNDMAEEGFVPDVVTYNVLMGIYVDQGDGAKALSLLEVIKEKGFIPNPASYSTALLAYRSLEDGNGALKFFLEFRDKYENGEMVEDGYCNWEKERVLIQKHAIDACQLVMRKWLAKGENFSTNVLRLLTDMDGNGLELSRDHYERLIWACTGEEHYYVGKELYRRIRERHFGISLSVCNHVIWLMGLAKKWWAALEIYEGLLEKGPKPNEISRELIISNFNVLLSAASKRGIWRYAVNMLNKMEEKGLKTGSKEYDLVLIAYSKAWETNTAIQVFKRMVDQGEKPTIVSYGALLSALKKGKLYDGAIKVWDHMIKLSVRPNIYIYTIMASVFTAKQNFEMVEAILKEMTEAGIKPTVVTFNAIISACAQNGMSDTAYEWFHRMKAQNITPDAITYGPLIEALAKDGKPQLAYELYLKARNDALNLSFKAYDAVVQSSQTLGTFIDISLLGPQPEETKKPQTRKNLADAPPTRKKPYVRKVYIRQSKLNH